MTSISITLPLIFGIFLLCTKFLFGVNTLRNFKAQMTKVRCCSLRTWAVKTRFWRSWGYFGRHFFRTKFSNYWFVFGAWNKISNTHGKKIRFVCYWKNLYMIYLIRYKCIYKWFGFVFYLFQYFVCIFGMFIYFSFLTCFTLCQQTCDGVS